MGSLPAMRVFVVVAVLAVGWSATPARAFDHGALARTALEAHIRPSYARLATAFNGLSTAIATHCDGSKPALAPELSTAFEGAVVAWGRIEHIRFGPVTVANRYERMAFWPDAKGLGARQVRKALLSQDPSVTEAGPLARKSVAIQGLTALEIVLFATLSETTFRCAYARAIAANLATIAKDVSAEWQGTGGHTALWLAPGPDNAAYREARETTAILAKSFDVGLEFVRDIKIGRTLGMGTAGKRAALPAFETSGLSTRLIAANIEGLADLFTASGLNAALNAAHPGIGAGIAQELKTALLAVSEVSVPLGAASEDDAAFDALVRSGFPLKSARTTAAEYLARTAEVSLGFSALDGD